MTADDFRWHPTETLRQLDERRPGMIDTPEVQAAFAVFYAHVRYEAVDYDIDRLMATMVPEPVFRLYGLGETVGYDGAQAVRESYLAGFVDRPGGMQIERLVIDGATVVVEGLTLFSSPGALALAERGRAPFVDRQRRWAFCKRRVLVCPIVDGLMAGETAYFDGPLSEVDLLYFD